MICTNSKKVALALCIAFNISIVSADINITNQTIYDEHHSKESISEQFNLLEEKQVDEQYRNSLKEEDRYIRNIIVQNNNLIAQESILIKVPFQKGKLFNPLLTSQAIKNIYSLGYFKQVQIFGDNVVITENKDKQKNGIDLYIVVQEKPKLSNVSFTGNKHITTKKLLEDSGLDKTPTIDESELPNFIARIKKLYKRKNYHFADITAQLEIIDSQHVEAHFNIKEHKKSYIERINFKGNNVVPSKKLKRIIFSKEYWVLSPMDKTGSFQEEMVQADKALIEDGYKSNGFLHAKVTDVQVNHNNEKNTYDITYTIHEGDVYHIDSIQIEGNDILSTQQLKASIPLQEGQRYSVELLRTSMEQLRLLWGEYGYIFADIEPSMQVDDEKKTVNIQFNFDLKDKVYLNRITIKGNNKTRDKVIRRSLLLDEGDLITNKKMDQSVDRIKMLGFFDEKSGVNWKTLRLDDTHADLDLILDEVKTGKFNTSISYGGGSKSNNPNTGITGNITLAERNLFGSGIAVSAVTEISKRYKGITASLMNPWLFDMPLRGILNTYHKQSEYEDGIKYAEHSPYENIFGGFIGLGYVSKLFGDCLIEGQLGFETIDFQVHKNKSDSEEEDKLSNQTSVVRAAKRLSETQQIYYQEILNRNFQSGDQYFAKLSFSKDHRNGTAFITNGYKWNWSSQFAFPITNKGFKYFKTELDASWYTPLIGENSLVLCLHGHAGFIRPLDNKNAPWKTLFHVGGPTTVRGYTYGQIGPTWLGDSMGATKSLYVNAEFIIPLTQDQSMRAVVFYDGGAGWDVPYKEELRKAISGFDQTLENDSFFYRHSVGVGIRISRPTPIQVDFGIKLNPSKKYKKHLTEVHFSMSHEF